MSAEKSTEWLIDLLYEERDEEATTDAMGEESESLPELDNAQQEELSAMLAMLGEVREAMPVQEPPARVRASILEAAHKQAEASTARAASSTGRRAPSGGRAPTESLWSSRNQNRAMSFAAVLCVLIGAGVFASRMTSSPQEARFSDASSGVSEQVTFGDQEPQQLAQNEAPAPADNKPGAMAATAPTEENDFPNVDTNTLEPSLDQRDANKQTLAYKLEERQEDKNNLDDAFADKKKPSRSAKSVAKTPATKSASKNSTRPFIGYGQDEVTSKEVADIENDYSLDSLAKKDKEFDQQTGGQRGSGSIFGGPESVARAEEKPAANKKMDSVAGNAMPPSADRDYAPEPEMDSPADAGEARTTSSSSREDDDGGIIQNWRARRSARKSKSSASAPKREVSYDSKSAVAPAETAPTTEQTKTRAPRVEEDQLAEMEKKQAPSKPPVSNNNTTLADVENAKRTEDADETLETADAFLARGIGTDRERARALELKAEALKELGRGEDARLVYQELESKYPTYYKKENVREKKKRAKRKSKASTDFADESFEDVGF